MAADSIPLLPTDLQAMLDALVSAGVLTEEAARMTGCGRIVPRDSMGSCCVLVGEHGPGHDVTRYVTGWRR